MPIRYLQKKNRRIEDLRLNFKSSHVSQRVLNRWSKLSEQKLRFFSKVKIIKNVFKMACSPIFRFFRDTFFFMTFTRSHGPSTMHMEYYGTLQRRLADLQAIIGIRPWKH